MLCIMEHSGLEGRFQCDIEWYGFGPYGLRLRPVSCRRMDSSGNRTKVWSFGKSSEGFPFNYSGLAVFLVAPRP